MGVGAKIESWIMPSLKRFLNTMDYSSRITKSDYLLERIFSVHCTYVYDCQILCYSIAYSFFRAMFTITTRTLPNLKPLPVLLMIYLSFM